MTIARRDLVEILARSLARLDVEQRVSAALRARDGARPTRLVAMGKAAAAMARGAFERWDDAILEALIVTPDAAVRGFDDRVEQLRGGHPVPDRGSVRAADRALALARACSKDGARLLVLISGGASALVCGPADGVGLARKQAVTRAMLRSGASIQQLNVVRKHLSTIKGGGLARAASPAPVWTLVASDVIAGEPADVGSGPSVSDPSTPRDARRWLRRYTGDRFDALPLVRTGQAGNAKPPRVIAAPEELARRARDELRALGLVVRVLPPSQADVTELAREYLALAARLPPGHAVVRAAEPSVRIDTRHGRRGRGGRSTHLAALVGRSLSSSSGILFMAAATDGVDGVSGTAGAIVDGAFPDRVSVRAIDDAVTRFATGALHRRAKTALPMAPTGHNLADLHMLVHRG